MMLSCNRLRVTRTAIEEIVARTTTPYRLTVLDNGSTDGSGEMLHGLWQDRAINNLMRHKDNNGVHWGHNWLLDQVQTPLYICADNDLIPQSPIDGVDWLALLLGVMERHPDYAAIACRPHVMIGDSVVKMFADAPEVVERGHIGAHLRLMRTEAVRATGGWQRQVRPSRNHEEKWICKRLKQDGWKVGYARDVRCIHLFGEPELGEDSWGYSAGTYHEGHTDRWPPVHHFQWDRQGVDWETCR
jgi:GT2 family glycosyltransferase